MGNDSPLDHVIEILLSEHRRHPVALDPTFGQSGPRGGSAPSRSFSLPLRRRLLRALQSGGLALRHRRQRSLARACYAGARTEVAEGLAKGERKKKGGEESALLGNPEPAIYKGPLPSG